MRARAEKKEVPRSHEKEQKERIFFKDSLVQAGSSVMGIAGSDESPNKNSANSKKFLNLLLINISGIYFYPLCTIY